MNKLNSGDLVDHYEILTAFDHKGMGAVYLAQDTQLSRTVVLKLYLGDSEILKKRFEREANIAASLNHENIIKIFSFGHYEQYSYMVMEYFESQPLSALIDSGEIDFELALVIFKKFLEGLATIHDNGFIHRDIKPANILWNDKHELKIIDFGISKSLNEEDLKLTQTHHFVGTIHYVAPEILKGGDPSPSSDIFSAGILLYELVTGKNPFEKMTKIEIIAAIQTQKLRLPKGDNLNYSLKLPLIFKKMVEIDANQRYQSVSQILDDLESIQTQSDVPSFQNLLVEAGQQAVNDSLDSIRRVGKLKASRLQINFSKVDMKKQLTLNYQGKVLFVLLAILFVLFQDQLSVLNKLTKKVDHYLALKSKSTHENKNSEVNIRVHENKKDFFSKPGAVIHYSILNQSGDSGQVLGRENQKIILTGIEENRIQAVLTIAKSGVKKEIILNKNPFLPVVTSHPKLGPDIQFRNFTEIKTLFPIQLGRKGTLEYYQLKSNGSYSEFGMKCHVFDKGSVDFLDSMVAIFKVACTTVSDGMTLQTVHFYSPFYNFNLKSVVEVKEGNQSIIKTFIVTDVDLQERSVSGRGGKSD